MTEQLLGTIKSDLGQYVKPDGRGEFYAGSEIANIFRAHAQSIAFLIEKNGLENTDPQLIAIAREVQKLGARYSDGTALVKAFEAAIKAPTSNPFAGLKLTL